MTKRNQGIVKSYERSEKSNLNQCYGRFSKAKADAWEYCKELCKSKDGSGLKILSANVYQFTAGFKYEENGKQYLMYISKSENRPIEIGGEA